MNRTDSMGRLHEIRQKIDAEHRGRIEFVAKLRRTVAGLRKNLMDENRAVHAAWFGPTRAELAKVARIKEEAAARVKEAEEVARVKATAAAAARVKEAAEVARAKEAAAAAAARAKEAAEVARAKEAAAAAAARVKEAAKTALVKAAAKTAPVKATPKPAKKVRGD